MKKSMKEIVKRWTARRKTVQMIDISQGEATVAEASRTYDLTPSQVEIWVDDTKKGMEISPRATLQDILVQYERQLKDLRGAYGEIILELRIRARPEGILSTSLIIISYLGRYDVIPTEDNSV